MPAAVMISVFSEWLTITNNVKVIETCIFRFKTVRFGHGIWTFW